ncbi:MAG: hypothetical protein ACOX78_07425 [Lachnospiraceae bacterium]|jgi:hypothetical protein
MTGPVKKSITADTDRITCRRRRLLTFLLLFIVWIVLSALYAHYHSRVIVSSDTTTTLPAAADVLAGNVWLKNWILGSNNFYFTEILVYALGLFLGISCQTLIACVPAVFLALTFCLLLAFILPELTRCRHVLSYIIFAAAFTAVLLIVPYSSSYTLLNANSHNNLYALVMICVLLAGSFPDGRLWPLLLMTVLGSLLYFSKGVTLMVLIAPLLLFGVLQAISRKKIRPLFLSLSAALMYAGGKGLSWLFTKEGGLVTRGIPIHLIQWSDFSERAAEWLDEIGSLFGTSLVSFPFSVFSFFARVLACFWACSILISLIRIVRLSWRRQMLLLIAVLNIAGCLFTDVAVSYRYIVPAFLCGMVLLFLQLADLSEFLITKMSGLARSTAWRASSAFLSVFVLVPSVFCGTVKWSDFSNTSVYGTDEKALADFIEDRSLGNGFALFWNASAIASYSDFSFQVLPVYTHTGSGTFIAYPELIRRDWYEQKDIHYFIYNDETDSEEVPEQLVFIAGEPDTSFTIGHYTLYWWDQDLSDLLDNGLYDNLLSGKEFYTTSTDCSLETDGSWTLLPDGQLQAAGEALAPGSYTFTFSGAGISGADITVESEKLGELAHHTAGSSADSHTGTSDTVTLSVDVSKAVEDISITITNLSESGCTVENLRTSRTSDP